MAIAVPRSLGMLLLAVWLILTGAEGFATGLVIPSAVRAVLALISGVLLLIGR